MYGTERALSKWVWVAADGARGLLKYPTNNVAGMVLAVGPQTYLNYKSSTTMSEFYRKEIYNRPANVTSANEGVVGGKLATIVCGAAGLGMIGLVLVIGESFITGSGALYLIDPMG